MLKKIIRKYDPFTAAVCLCCFPGLLVFPHTISSAESVTISVSAGAQQIYKGTGSGRVMKWGTWAGLPDKALDTLSSIQKNEFNSVFHQFHIDGDERRSFQSHYGKWITLLRSEQRIHPGIIFLFTSGIHWHTKSDSGYQEAVDSMASIARGFRDSGVVFSWSTVNSEPNQKSDLVKPDGFINWMKKLRKAYDDKGLQDIKLMAPSCSNVNNDTRDLANAIIADPEALAITDAFSFHSYNNCMRKFYRDIIWEYMLPPHGKQFWQDESGCFGGGDRPDTVKTSYPVNHPSRFFAVNYSARFMGDVNLGTQYWCGYKGTLRQTDTLITNELGYVSEFARNGSNYPYVVTYSGDSTNPDIKIIKFLQYYYIRQLSDAFVPGTKIRLSSSDLVSWSSNTSSSRFEWMEFTYGEKPQAHALAGVDPDGKWVLGVVNQTGMSHYRDTTYNKTTGVGTAHSKYAPANPYEVTFDVAELKDSGNFEFQVFRSNGNSFYETAEKVTMENGTVTLAVGAQELVTLKSIVPVSVTPDFSGENSVTTKSMVHIASEKSANMLNVILPVASNPRVENTQLSMQIFDPKGRAANIEYTLRKQSGKTVLRVDTSPLPRGIYVLKIAFGDFNHTEKLLINP